MPHQPVRGLTLITTTPRTPVPAWSALGQRLRHSIHRWAVDSQRAACRNAMVAGTVLAQRRVEREEVEEFLAARQAPPARDGDAGHTARA